MTEVKLCLQDYRTDINTIYEFMMSDDQYLFSTRLTFNTQRQFEEWFFGKLNSDFNDFYVIKIKEKIIGFIHDYDFSLVDGHCKVSIFLQKEYRSNGYGSISTIIFMKFLFMNYPLRKIYSTVYDNNKESLKNNIRAGFEEEGCLDSYRYYNGNYSSLHILSINRKKFFSTIGRIV